MSRTLLSSLNGKNSGELLKFLNDFEGDPRIAWYPSAGVDFRALLYLHPSYALLNPASEPEPTPPDLFIYTDFKSYGKPKFLSNGTVYSDGRTKIDIEYVEELPKLMQPIQSELPYEGDLDKPYTYTNRIFYIKINIQSKEMGFISFPVIYAFIENESFFGNILYPNKAKISHIVHVRYGGGGGGGGNASGGWLLNILKLVNCEMFITDNHHTLQEGDKKALKMYSFIPTQSSASLKPIRVLSSKSWSEGYGDVSWNKVL